jgi:tetratricopeptide (TPR) repeat protein
MVSGTDIYRNAARIVTMLFLGILLFVSTSATAQGDSLSKARQYVDARKYDDAISIYQKLYSADPNSEVSDEYFDVLLLAKRYKDAEKLLNVPSIDSRARAMEIINHGRIELAQGKEKKADEFFKEAIALINGDEMITLRIVNAFKKIDRDDYIIIAYEKARQILGNPYFYSEQLGRLYAKSGDVEKAIVTLIQGSSWQQGGIETTKATLLEVLGTDAKKMQLAQKALIKKINEQPQNQTFPELLTWLYTQKDDWEGALMQVQAIDERNREDGLRLMEFARTARREKKYDIALKSFDAVLEKGKDKQYYTTANFEKLGLELDQLENNVKYTPQDVTKLIAEYEAFLKEYPDFYATELARDYAMLEAQYNNNPQKGIDILQRVIDQTNTRKDISGMAKLQMGDYLILTGKIWDASLMYSQVDKASREDMLGEEARFKNAKLSYYRGDFGWAQGQLKVLKASTSELIANDALSLSVLITENTPDSNTEALSRFAYADLLLFQNKDKEAETLLDSIATGFPEHTLQDDILMLHAKIAEKHRNYPDALTYYEKVANKYGNDVLGDDAIFKSAQIYETKMNKPEEAKRLYEDLIVKYPGSTYVQTARKRLAELNTPAGIVP